MASLVSNVRKSGNGVVRYMQRQTRFSGDGERLKAHGRYEKHLSCERMTDEGKVTGAVLCEERHTGLDGKVSVMYLHSLKFTRTSVFGGLFRTA